MTVKISPRRIGYPTISITITPSVSSARPNGPKLVAPPRQRENSGSIFTGGFPMCARVQSGRSPSAGEAATASAGAWSGRERRVALVAPLEVVRDARAAAGTGSHGPTPFLRGIGPSRPRLDAWRFCDLGFFGRPAPR